MPSKARYAIYFLPPSDARLGRLGTSWLGRAIQGPATPPRPDLLDEAFLAAITGQPRRYGFHATLKAPFRLRDQADENRLSRALLKFCATRTAIRGPELRPATLGDFVALRPVGDWTGLHALADDVVRFFDRFRASPDAGEWTRWTGLAGAEVALLERWGYPHVMERFRFHMTLTDRLDPADVPRVLKAARRHFGPIAGQGFDLDALSLVRQASEDGDFQLVERVPLGGHGE